MADDKLKKILHLVIQAKSELDAQRKVAIDSYEADMLSAAQTLRRKLIPRLQEAREIWAQEDVTLEISDNTEKDFRNLHGNSGQLPEIGVAVTLAGRAIFHFRAHYSYVSIVHGLEENPIPFMVQKVDALTDDFIDRVLELLLRQANGLGSDY